MSAFFEVVLFWLAIVFFILISLIIILYCTFAYIDSYGSYSDEIKYYDKDGAYQQLIEEFDYSTPLNNIRFDIVDDDETFWKIILENRKQSSGLLNECNDHWEARRLLEINGWLILERNKRKRTCESEKIIAVEPADPIKAVVSECAEADFRGMIVAEAFVILPKLLMTAYENGNQWYTVYTGDLETLEKDCNQQEIFIDKSENNTTPLRLNIGYWLNLKGYQYREYEVGKLEIVVKNTYPSKQTKKFI